LRSSRGPSSRTASGRSPPPERSPNTTLDHTPAPIYWLLQSSKKNYALWIYYHRLDKDILFKALLNYVEPKIRKEEARLGELRSQKAALGPAAKGAKKIDKDIDRQMIVDLRRMLSGAAGGT